jgi:hypothetical protein
VIKKLMMSDGCKIASPRVYATTSVSEPTLEIWCCF